MEFAFEKETILPASDPRSPFYVNLPPANATPIDDLIEYFRFWKLFIKSLIHYCKEIALVKEYESNLNSQLIGAVQFPGFKNLPKKYSLLVEQHIPLSPTGSNGSTPKNELRKTLLNTSDGPITPPSEIKRPNLLKTKSNQLFLKSTLSFPHKRNLSVNSLKNASLLSLNGGTLPIQHATLSSLSTPMEKEKPKNDVVVPPHFFPEDSLFNNLAPALMNHHYQQFQAQVKFHRELVTKLIPRLENLSKNLSSKIKEIKLTLKNESFVNNQLVKEISLLGKVLKTYMSAVERFSGPKPVLKHTEEVGPTDVEDDAVSDDPFLLKLHVDYQLKTQLIHENYMFASFVNLQSISKDLLTYVTKELNVVVDRLSKLITQESVYSSASAELVVNLANILKKTVPQISSQHDWQHFISHNPNFINLYESTDRNPRKEIRNFSSITLPYANSIHNKCLRFGIMYKKLKILKNYNSYYYVLTCNYLHEFKLERETSTSPEGGPKKSRKDKIGGFIGHDDEPVKSYNLNDYSIKVKDPSSLKFVLIKASNSSHRFTFKCANDEEFEHWYGDLNELLKFGPKHLHRFALVQDKVLTREAELSAKKAEKKTDSLKLNLSSLVVQDEPLLSGIFTPRIRTPSGSAKSERTNPFEETFDIPRAASPSLDRENNSSDVSLAPALIATSPTGTQGTIHLPHQVEHETYLRMQQEVLKQQQEVLSLKIQQAHENGKNRLTIGLRVLSAESMDALRRGL